MSSLMMRYAYWMRSPEEMLIDLIFITLIWAAVMTLILNENGDSDF